jgi:hypothetical protein
MGSLVSGELRGAGRRRTCTARPRYNVIVTGGSASQSIRPDLQCCLFENLCATAVRSPQIAALVLGSAHFLPTSRAQTVPAKLHQCLNIHAVDPVVIRGLFDCDLGEEADRDKGEACASACGVALRRASVEEVRFGSAAKSPLATATAARTTVMR